MRTVKDIIRSKAPVFNTVVPDTHVIDALNLLNSVNLSYLVVMEGEKYKGIFCESDYTRNVILKGRASKTATVQEVMTTDLPVVELTDTVEHCMYTINSYRTRYLLAYDDRNFIDVITIHDILREVIASKEMVFDNEHSNALFDENKNLRIF